MLYVIALKAYNHVSHEMLDSALFHLLINEPVACEIHEYDIIVLQVV